MTIQMVTDQTMTLKGCKTERIFNDMQVLWLRNYTTTYEHSSCGNME